MSSLAVILFFVGLMPLALIKPHVGVLAWVLSGLMNPHRLTGGAAYTFPFSMMIGGVTLFAVIANRKEWRPLPWSPPLILLTAMVVWMNVTTVFAIMPDVAWPQWEKVMKIMVMTYVAFWTIHTKERVIALTVVMAFAVGFYGIKGGIFTVLTGGQFMVVGPPHSLIAGNTEVSLALTMILPYFVWMRMMLSNRLLRLAMLGLTLAIAFAIVGSYSRGAFLAGGAMGFFLWLKSDRKIPVMIAIAVVVPVMMNFMPDKYHEKMSTIETYEEDASALGRINAWWFAYHLANDHPLTGGGFNIFHPRMFLKYAPEPDDYHDAHSNYFQMLGHHGYPGLLLFLGVGLSTWLLVGRVARRSKNVEELYWAHQLARITQVSIIGYAVGGAFLTLAYLDLFYYQVVIVLAMNRIVDETLAKTTETVANAEASAAVGGRLRRGMRGPPPIVAPMPGMSPAPALAVAAPGAGGARPGLPMARRAAGAEVRASARPFGGRRQRDGQDTDKPKKRGAFDLIAAALEVGSGAPNAKASEKARPLAHRRGRAAGATK